jgi:hypothetical protein
LIGKSLPGEVLVLPSSSVQHSFLARDYKELGKTELKPGSVWVPPPLQLTGFALLESLKVNMFLEMKYTCRRKVDALFVKCVSLSPQKTPVIAVKGIAR